MSSSDPPQTTYPTCSGENGNLHFNAVQTSVDGLEVEQLSAEHDNIVPPTDLSDIKPRVRTMTEKGLEYSVQTKEEIARTASKGFQSNVSQFQSFLIKARDPDQIDKELDKLSDLAAHVDNKLADWHKLVSDSQQAAICKDLFENMQKALRAAKSTALERLTQLENENKSSIASSHKSRRSVISRKSSRSRRSVYSQEDA